MHTLTRLWFLLHWCTSRSAVGPKWKKICPLALATERPGLRWWSRVIRSLPRWGWRTVLLYGVSDDASPLVTGRTLRWRLLTGTQSNHRACPWPSAWMEPISVSCLHRTPRDFYPNSVYWWAAHSSHNFLLVTAPNLSPGVKSQEVGPQVWGGSAHLYTWNLNASSRQ